MTDFTIEEKLIPSYGSALLQSQKKQRNKKKKVSLFFKTGKFCALSAHQSNLTFNLQMDKKIKITHHLLEKIITMFH